MSKIGDRVRQARKAIGDSQEDLAARIHVNRSYISLVENGKSSPTFEFLEKVASGLNMNVEDLVVGQPITGMVSFDATEGPAYEGLVDLLHDEEQMLLMNPSPDEIGLLKTIRVDPKYHPSKRFFIEALLDYRKNKLAR